MSHKSHDNHNASSFEAFSKDMRATCNISTKYFYWNCTNNLNLIIQAVFGAWSQTTIFHCCKNENNCFSPFKTDFVFSPQAAGAVHVEAKTKVMRVNVLSLSIWVWIYKSTFYHPSTNYERQKSPASEYWWTQKYKSSTTRKSL